jgi:rare lipoprotein A
MRHPARSFSSCALLPATVLATVLLADTAPAQPIALTRAAVPAALTGEVIVGIASFYDEPGETASGEPYDPGAFTAAALVELRDKFGGIKFGRDYRPAYALAEYGGRRAILKINDVGPLRPGRKFDLSRAAMAHFGGLDKGLLPDLKITLLPSGGNYTPGPLVDVSEPLRFDADKPQIMGFDFAAPEPAIASRAAEAEAELEPELTLAIVKDADLAQSPVVMAAFCETDVAPYD